MNGSSVVYNLNVDYTWKTRKRSRPFQYLLVTKGVALTVFHFYLFQNSEQDSQDLEAIDWILTS